ncbi:sugar ABC transporter ATP-binding protein [Microvirga tunisiensis]|uniref:Sugar ABC transporter ATP-binding protein n=1 Tax=Microvirga tunisiensis TaxID=2108360 RepID=A0A5N7MII5_9HYPH|nr:sugar ABC transporter ATP-binding protein [Microvirga tunisiensis]MPR05546.1 sugar ABC transporter ATP-binding protein [Microvirga tunisiensis]MPR23746.1 sugar ABC transporter ATP-binding protein [Microvirga tunisiensis]
MAHNSAARNTPAAKATGLVKQFGPRAVLADVDLTVEHYQVHALIGANGSGKSTLAKIMAGYYQRDAGQLVIAGSEVPTDAGVASTEALGVRVVHQDLGLFDGISVLENVAAGGGYIRTRLGLIDWPATRQRVAEALARVGLDNLDPDNHVDDLPTWQRVAVACARALYDGLDVVRLLILDEITAALPPSEVRLVLDLVRRLQLLGAGILYVTHRFEEVMEVTDRITVLRDGKLLVNVRTADVTVRQLVEWVSGDQVSRANASGRKATGAPVLELRGISTERLKNVSLELRQGDICGVIGRAACGKSALGRTIFGQEKILSGSMLLAGQPLLPRNPRDAIRRGVAYVPQDRQRAGILPGATLRENFTITNLGRVMHGRLLSSGLERKVAAELIDRHAVVPRDSEEWIQNLSGGNQQKIVVGRWDLTDNLVFVLDEPTEGVDAAARASIYAFIRERAAAGAAVLVLSSSLEEIADVCDRAICLTDGRMTHSVEGDALTVRNMEHLLVSELEESVPSLEQASIVGQKR